MIFITICTSSLTEVCRVVMCRALNSDIIQERHNVWSWTLEHTLSCGHYIHVVKHGKQLRAWSVHWAHNSSTTLSQQLQQIDALGAWHIIQSSRTQHITTDETNSFCLNIWRINKIIHVYQERLMTGYGKKALAHNSFQLYLPFYFHFSVTEGKDITFLYQLAAFWQMPIISKQLPCFLTFDSP